MASSFSPVPPPYPKAPIGTVSRDEISGAPIVEVSKGWGIYFRDQRQFLTQVASRTTPTVPAQLDQNAAISATTLVTPANGGLYSFEYYLAIVTAAGVSSSATVSIAWTDQAQSKSKTFTAITGNTITTTGSERYLIRVDGGAPVTFAVAYASNPANAMHYSIYPIVSSVAQVA